ncbi:FecR family protein [Sphingobacterium haloxyli]|nr:FecR domain-containing protein [Sphingobacterium haloxyli]
MEKKTPIQRLFQKYIDETIDKNELAELTGYVNSEEYDSLWRELLEAYYQNSNQKIPDILQRKSISIVNDTWKQINQQLDRQLPVKQIRTGRIAKLYKYAAAVFILFAFSGIWYYYKYDRQNRNDILSEAQDIQPGTNRATLILSDGQTIDLSESQNGLVINEKGISYNDGTSILQTNDIQIATVTTPRAGQYQVTLPDGSKVWLNAASTLTYPTQFSGDERRVELKGEGYFEVKAFRSSISMPFIVATGEQEVKVLGTQFNVKAYQDETAIQTTLVEGKVRITTAQGTPLDLSPGMQSNLEGQRLSVTKVNTEDYTAWKEGLIVLERQSIADILQQLERWYDVEFTCQKGTNLPSKTLSGEVFRDLPLSVLLQALEEQTNLRFERKERRIMVKN